MKLTRRDALLGAATGLAGGSTLAVMSPTSSRENITSDSASELSDNAITMLVDLADVIYPTDVTVTPMFVEGYVSMLRSEHVKQVQRAVSDLNDFAQSVADEPFEVLSHRQREAILWEMGIDNVHPRPHGTVAARVRYHLVNGLLLALFTSPKGTKLFDVENPIGYPAGYHGSGQVGGDSDEQ